MQAGTVAATVTVHASCMCNTLHHASTIRHGISHTTYFVPCNETSHNQRFLGESNSGSPKFERGTSYKLACKLVTSCKLQATSCKPTRYKQATSYNLQVQITSYKATLQSYKAKKLQCYKVTKLWVTSHKEQLQATCYQLKL